MIRWTAWGFKRLCQDTHTLSSFLVLLKINCNMDFMWTSFHLPRFVFCLHKDKHFHKSIVDGILYGFKKHWKTTDRGHTGAAACCCIALLWALSSVYGHWFRQWDKESEKSTLTSSYSMVKWHCQYTVPRHLLSASTTSWGKYLYIVGFWKFIKPLNAATAGNELSG